MLQNPTQTRDEVEARLHVRVPLKAGPHDDRRDVPRATDALNTRRLQPFVRTTADTSETLIGPPHIDTFDVTGPFNPTGPATRRAAGGSSCVGRPTRRAAPEANGACAPQDRLDAGAPRVSRRRYADADVETAARASTAKGRARAAFDAGIAAGARSACSRARSSCSASSAIRRRRAGHGLPRQRPRAGVAPVVLPLEQHSRRRAAAPWPSRAGCSTPAVLEQQVRRMLADRAADALVEQLRRPVAVAAQPAKRCSPTRDEFPDFDDNLRQALPARDRAVLREHRARGPQRRSTC